jgi:putative membrane protein
MMQGGGHMFGYGSVFMMITWIVLIIAVIYVLIRITQKNGAESSRRETPLDILKKRYARGELSKEEFEERKKDLQ